MNRFDSDFNGVDHETWRPFSAGHPDGVWMISIMYGLLALVSLVALIFGALKMVASDASGYMIFFAALINVAIFSSTIYFLFKRSVVSIYIIAVLAILAVCTGLLALIFSIENKYIFLGVACLQSYCFIYVLGLKNNKLLY